MDFIISNKKEKDFINTVKVGIIFLNYSFNHEVKFREFYYNDSTTMVLADANLGFINKLKKGLKTKEGIESIINNLKNGFVILINKIEESIQVYNDIFGFYHLFYLKNNEKKYLSNNYNDINKS